MAKKEVKKKESKKDKKAAAAEAAAAETAAPAADGAAAPAAETAAPAAQAKAAKKGKGKKGKGANVAADTVVPPELNAQAQLEQAIRESSDPAARLKKLKSPLNLKSILLSLLILIVVTIGIFYLWAFIKVDKFDFVTVTVDMLDQLGITAGFQWLGAQITGWFS